MKKYMILLIITGLSISYFAQTINKKFSYKDKKRDYFFYNGSYPVNQNQILTIFDFDKTYELHLYDKDFNEVGVKEIPKKVEGRYNTDMYLSDNFLFIEQVIDKKPYIIKVELNKDLNHEKLNLKAIPANFRLQNINNDNSTFYFTGAQNENFFKLNLISGEVTKYTIKLEEKERLYVDKYSTFQTNDYIGLCRQKVVKKNTTYEVVLHDSKGVEIGLFNRNENNKFYSTVDFISVGDDVYTFGNYKESPSKNEISTYEDHFKHPSYTGVYLRSLNSENPVEKYFEYSDFKSFNNQLVLDKNVKSLKKFRFRLEDLIITKNEKIVFATIDQDAYEWNNQGSKGHKGQELKYILIFGLDNEGELKWDIVIPLVWENHSKYKGNSFCKTSNFPKTINVKKLGDVIQCHYSFKEKITYFELKDGQIVNKKETPYVSKPDNSKKIEFQYKNSYYWYDNFYFNETGIGEDYQLDKIEFKK